MKLNLGRKCAVCGGRSGAITGFRTALRFFGYSPSDGYAHEKCMRRLKRTRGLAGYELKVKKEEREQLKPIVKPKVKRPSTRAKDYITYVCLNASCDKLKIKVKRHALISYPRCGECAHPLYFAS